MKPINKPRTLETTVYNSRRQYHKISLGEASSFYCKLPCLHWDDSWRETLNYRHKEISIQNERLANNRQRRGGEPAKSSSYQHHDTTQRGLRFNPHKIHLHIIISDDSVACRFAPYQRHVALSLPRLMSQQSYNYNPFV